MTALRSTVLLGVLVVGLLGGCAEAPPGESRPGGPQVYAVNYPLRYFAERIAGNRITIRFPGTDGDPAYWQPAPEDIVVCQDADLILLNGAGYARWVSKVSLPSTRLIDTGGSFAKRLIRLEGRVTHSHGPDGEHAHRGFAFTTWLDPQLAIEQAAAVQAAFARKWPEHAGAFERGFATLKRDLQALDAEWTAITSGKGDVPLVMSHPVYQYLERRCDLNAKSVHWEPDVAPDDEMVAAIKAMLSAHPARWMVWESEPLPESVRLLADLGVGSVVFDPCANAPNDGDFLTVMQRNTRALARALAP